MQVQSAATIALESMKYLATFSARKGFGASFDAECRALLAARPTAVVLYNAIERVMKDRSRESLEKVVRELEAAKEITAKNAAKIFPSNAVVLTHCHSTFVVAALVRNRQKIREVIVTETRPRDQGVRTAKELVAARVPVSFIVDSAISDFISRTDIVVVGADALRKEGLVNKVGTHPLALVAKENSKPLYVVTSSFTIDRRKNILMEQRPAAELQHPDLHGAKIFNPAFDITPWKYITAVVTENGIITPGKIRFD